MPIFHDGEFLGTLCAIDPSPAKLKDSTAPALFELFAELIGAHLAARRRLAVSQAALIDQREAAELREQFIAVICHDLRNPLASIDAAGRLLKKTPLNERASSLVDMMHESVVRMAGLIDNVLDLARGRLGGGFAIEPRAILDLPRVLEQVLGELRLAHPGRVIEAEISLPGPVQGDGRRLAQLLSNLVANALVHGAKDGPVRVGAHADGQRFELWVANVGPAIPQETQARLFQPFTRASLRPHQQGLGLGLYIASEIARAHGGILEVASDDVETRFNVRIPLDPAITAA